MSQEVNGEEHLIDFFSRKLTATEKNYSIVEQECLSIKWSLDSLFFSSAGGFVWCWTMHDERVPLTPPLYAHFFIIWNVVPLRG